MSNPLLSIAHHYHQRTKYDPETISSKNKRLDWENQPTPYKEYKLGKVFDLKPYLSTREEVPENVNSKQWTRLSLLLLYSYGLTAQLETPYGEPVFLRSAPSAGGLYPGEVYIISRGSSWLPPGLYNYQVRSHSLINFWETHTWSELQSACFEEPCLDNTEIAIVISSVFQRSVWRYEDRAYRRVFLDIGHLIGNIELAAAINDYKAFLVGGFCDEEVNNILYLDGDEESAISVIPLLDLEQDNNKKNIGTTALASQKTTKYPQVEDGELWRLFHQSTKITREQSYDNKIGESDSVEDKYNFPFGTKISTKTATVVDWGEQLQELDNTIINRRSTRGYNGLDLSLDELKILLNFTYQPQDYITQGLEGEPDYFALELIETFIAVSGITGLETGCYYYAPLAQELRQIRFKNFRKELHYLCLGQDLGRDAAAIIFHTVDLNQAVAKYGDRVYRYLHLDAGHLGQRINLAAIRMGLGVSGIAGFFDDRVNEVLGIPQEEAVIYLTTLGRPRVS